MKSRILLLALLVAVLSACSVIEQGYEVGNQAPVFSLTDINGNEINLKSLKGKVVLLDLWSKD